jgi:subtilisin family serine protease
VRRLAGILIGVAILIPATGFAVSPPNDPGWKQQWGLKKIHAAETWPITRGGGVAVAVIDTGVDLRHPDLRNRILPGHDFVDDDNAASDAKGHGTHVAGVIAAVTFNGFGVASVAPTARIIPIRVLDASGEGDPGDVADGIRWAVGHGAKVINLSLAQDEQLPIAGQHLLGDGRVDEAIRSAAARGVVVVVAAGNDDGGGLPETAYDATVPGVIVVGASTINDRRAAYSNFGAGLDVIAPGGGNATNPTACGDGDWIVSTWWNPVTQRSDYGGGCGTSMAVAHVSGIAAMLIARGLSGPDVVRRITATAVDLGDPGWDNDTGYGRVDALRAVRGASKPSRAPASPSPKPSVTFKPQGSPRATVAASAPRGRNESSPAGRAGPVALAAALAVATAAAHKARVGHMRRVAAHMRRVSARVDPTRR